MRQKKLIIVLLLGIITVFTSCNEKYAYDHYRQINVEGWNRDDTLDFNAGLIPTGIYNMYIGFRATSQYPYKELGLDISYTVYPTKAANQKVTGKQKTIHKRVKCGVFNDNGEMTGRKGISSDDFIYRAGTVTVNQGDSIVVSVTHAMNQDVMPGLLQIGIQLEPVR